MILSYRVWWVPISYPKYCCGEGIWEFSFLPGKKYGFWENNEKQKCKAKTKSNVFFMNVMIVNGVSKVFFRLFENFYIVY